MAQTPPDSDSPAPPPEDGGSPPRDAGAAEAIPYWQRHAARWHRHAARFAALATQVEHELRASAAPRLTGPVVIDLRPGRYWWFNHMAAIYEGWALRAEQRLRVLRNEDVAPS